ncbi:TPA: type 1 fimbrial protein [Proteus mirabilis]|nr:type 1 fimbrial protein [Proteus mirabilis]
MSVIKKITPVVVLCGLMGSGHALAKTQGTTVSFEALIRAASCNVSSTSEGAKIDWGVFTNDEVSNKKVGDKLGEDKKFNLELSNCTAALAADGAINLYARGNKANFNSDMFANATSSSLAVQLLATEKNTLIKPNVETALKLGKEITKDGKASIPMTASLYLTNGTVSNDELKVPVTFTVAYN